MSAITLDQLEVFIAVAESGSFSAAARRLHRTQSAVSYGIDNLERLLELVLLDREGYRPRLTAVGTSVLAHARAVLGEAGRLEGLSKRLREKVEAEVSLAIDAVVPPTLLVAALKGFRAAFPTVRVAVRFESKWSVIQLVDDGLCDVGICGPVPRVPVGLELRPLRSTEFVPVVAARHPLSRYRRKVPAAALREHPRLVLTERDARFRGEEQVTEGQVWRFADYDLKHRSLLAGLGWGFMPRDWVESELSRGSLRVLRIDGENVRPAVLSVVQRTSAPPGPAARWLLDRLAARRR